MTTQTSPAQRVAAVRARLQAITGALAGLDQTEQQRRDHRDRTQPELDAALADYKRAELRLEKARAAHPGSALNDLGSVQRRAMLEQERDQLETELATDLAPWAGL